MTVKLHRIPGQPGYAVSRDGRVWSCKRPGLGKGEGRWHVLKPSLNSNGYLLVNLCQEGLAKTYDVHILVARVFLGPRPAGMTVNHKDTNHFNNSAGNLEYLSLLDNLKHAREHGLGLEIGAKGSQHCMSKLSEADVLQMRRLYDSKQVSQKQLKNMYPHMSWAQIGRIVKRENWRHV